MLPCVNMQYTFITQFLYLSSRVIFEWKLYDSKIQKNTMFAAKLSLRNVRDITSIKYFHKILMRILYFIYFVSLFKHISYHIVSYRKLRKEINIKKYLNSQCYICKVGALHNEVPGLYPGLLFLFYFHNENIPPAIIILYLSFINNYKQFSL